jgi:hypothetical protein
MRSAVFTVLLLLSAFTAAAAQIDAIEPKSITTGSGEQFINIFGSGLGDQVIWSGKAGEFVVQVSSVGERSVVGYVPEAVVNTPGQYTIYVRGANGTAGPAYLDVVEAGQSPLVVLVPDPVVAASQSRSGAAVDYEVFPYGGSDPRPDLKCANPSGSLFPVGYTVFDCVASNSKGETGTSQVSVTVFDEPKSGDIFWLHLPEIVTADAPNREGAYVKFEVFADGSRDPRPTIKCDAESGQLFRIGSTTVSCTATDAYGATTAGQFEVSVSDPTNLDKGE